MAEIRSKRRRSSRTRVAIVALAAAALGISVLAPASQANHWEGTWRYTHQFGSGTMQLCEVFRQRNSGGFIRYVYGTYGPIGEAPTGRIWGDLIGGNNSRWNGAFRDFGPNRPLGYHDSGYYFRNDSGRFAGYWRGCPGCRTYQWRGRRIDNDPNGFNCQNQ